MVFVPTQAKKDNSHNSRAWNISCNAHYCGNKGYVIGLTYAALTNSKTANTVKQQVVVGSKGE
ncbi:hypothetical protein GCM10007377_01780 [Galliscardovia ingluviei]|uniref:Uncharacterized protein n=1 Tax=Galliscardovia ingluviei TaxID=1769422 RepID=A0A8J3AKG0_9BIFI|nr:hypothetical protein GCM10007377_01780 [Galliscardovia ingluviei]